jgi:mono/diheme cytochrome c family protein
MTRYFALSGVLVAVSAWILGVTSAFAASPSDDLVAAGQRLYREGRGMSGEPVQALVQRDVPLVGTQVPCQSCHGRSGMGAIESGRIPAALAGRFLFAPDAQRKRPAYTVETLARALRDGVDAAGKPIDPLMPRFRLGDGDIAALSAYLRQLGATPSPGVGKDTLQIATVIAGDVDSHAERAALEVLEAFVAARNRSGPQRVRGGHFPGQWKEGYREWQLDVWRLSGPSETWPAQLAARYRERPAFALVGGLATGSWQPIHDFCEQAQMPCLLPDTDLPPAVDTGYYSLYYSRGLALEADLIAAGLVADHLQARVVAVVDGDAGLPSGAAAAALARALELRGGSLRTLDLRRESQPAAVLKSLLEDRSTAIVLWLGAAGVARLAPVIAATNKGPPVFLSSTLLRGQWEAFPAGFKERAHVAHTTMLPGQADSALGRYMAWAKVRGIAITEQRHQALAYFAILAFAEATKHSSMFISRDYIMDLLEHTSTITAYLPLYPRGSMTPGQRVLSRGGYLIDLSKRREPEWLVP